MCGSDNRTSSCSPTNPLPGKQQMDRGTQAVTAKFSDVPNKDVTLILSDDRQIKDTGDSGILFALV